MFINVYQPGEICCTSKTKSTITPRKIEKKPSNSDFHHARSVFLQASLRSRVSSVNQEVDFLGRLVSVETGATELSTEFTSLENFSTFFITVIKGAKTSFSPSVARIGRLI